MNISLPATIADKPSLVQDLHKAVEFFTHLPQVREVWLFGSAAKGCHLDWRSDLDFAVSGLRPGEEYGIWSMLDEMLTHPVDLVRLEDANPLLKSEILKGYLIYENRAFECRDTFSHH